MLASAAWDERHPVTAPDTYALARTDTPPLLAFALNATLRSPAHLVTTW
ncbi:hypothetical protein [Streptomyces eurythermus]